MPTLNPTGRISRETRQLIAAALAALVALWVLSRIRFPERPVSPNPIPSLLSQITSAPRFANLAGELADLQSRLSGHWFAIPVLGSDARGEDVTREIAALRFRDDAALLVVSLGDRLTGRAGVLAADRVTGLTVIAADAGSANVVRWAPASLDRPQYMMATVGTPSGVSLRPVLVGVLHETTSPAWPGTIWRAAESNLTPSSFLFTTAGEIAGVVVREPEGLAIVPWEVATAEATRIISQPSPAAADLLLDVRALTPALARATGARTGVIVAWIDEKSPAARQLAVGDVIESLNDQPMATAWDWEVATGRLSAGQATMRIRRQSEPMELTLRLPPVAPSPSTNSLGLRMRDVPGGTRIVGVDPGSVASAARLREGDVITLAGRIRNPSAAEVRGAFQATEAGGVLIVAITRGDTHLVEGLEK